MKIRRCLIANLRLGEDKSLIKKIINQTGPIVTYIYHQYSLKFNSKYGQGIDVRLLFIFKLMNLIKVFQFLLNNLL